MTRRWKRRLLGLGFAVMVVAALGWTVMVMIPRLLRARLQAMVGTQLDAHLRIGDLRYHFPYGISLDDTALVAPAPDGSATELFRIKHVELTLAELPQRNGPLVIERLTLIEPSARVTRLADGTIAGAGVWKGHGSSQLAGSRLSDMFHLRRFTLRGGRFIYEDRTHPSAAPMVWSNLHLDLGAQATSAAAYRFHLMIDNLPTAEVAANGTMDIDALLLEIKDFALKVQVSPETATSHLPAGVQEQLRANRIDGALRLAGRARLPLLEADRSQFDVVLDLPAAKARLAQWDAAIDSVVLRMRVSNDPLTSAREGEAPSEPAASAATQATSQPAARTEPRLPAESPSAGVLRARIEQLAITSGDTQLELRKGNLVLDPVAGQWHIANALGTLVIGADHRSLPTDLRDALEAARVRGQIEFTAAASGPLRPPPGQRATDAMRYELVAVARDVSVQPAIFPQPIEQLNGTVHLRPGLIRFENLAGSYGPDRAFVAAAQVPLDDLAQPVRIEQIDGQITFATGADVRRAQYPDPLNDVLDALGPGGAFHVAGDVAISLPSLHTDYRLAITSETATLAPTPFRIPMADVRSRVLAARGSAEVAQFEATVADGHLSANGLVDARSAFTYRARGQVAGVDVKRLTEIFTPKGQASLRLGGQGASRFTVEGTGPQGKRTWLDNVRGSGEFEIQDGDFWEFPIVKGVLERVKLKQALTVGQAAGTFEIAEQKVTFKDAAVSAPVLGLQGDAVVDFDGRVDGRVVAAPLADWKEKLKSTNIPIISDTIGTLAGGLQKLLNGVTKEVFYEFRLGGTVAQPKYTTVPAPILTDQGARLFGKMIAPLKDESLLDAIRGKREGKKAP